MLLAGLPGISRDSCIIISTRVVSQLARGNRNLPSLLMGSARRLNYMDNLPSPNGLTPLTQIVSRIDSSNFHAKFNLNITKLAVTKKNINPKNTEKLPNHENACANIPCNFRDRDISRLGVGYLTHTIDTHTHIDCWQDYNIIKINAFYFYRKMQTKFCRSYPDF